MARIITTAYRYKRPPRKKPKAAALTMPAVATIPSKRRATNAPEAAAAEVAAAPAKADRKPSIVTARKPGARWHIDLPDLTEEEINRRADAAEALWRESVRASLSFRRMRWAQGCGGRVLVY